MQATRPAIALGLYLALSLVFVGYHGVRDTLNLVGTEATDFRVFYRAAEVVLSGQRQHLYKQEAPVPGDFDDAIGNYFNPPLLAALFFPLTFLPLLTAKAVFVGLMTACAAAIAFICGRWTRTPGERALAAAALASFWPAYLSLQVGQPSLAFALVALVSMAALEARRADDAGFWLGVLALKPSTALAHIALGLLSGGWPLSRTFALTALVLVLLPFLVLGLDSLADYRRLLSLSGDDAFDLIGEITGGAIFMFNWNGFYSRLTLDDPPFLLMLALYLVTAALMTKVWLRSDLIESWLAAALATNLAVPHLITYDLVLLVAPSLALAFTRRDTVTTSLLAGVHLAINASMYQLLVWGGLEIGTRQGFMLIVATPAMFLLLAYLAFEPAILKWRRRPTLEASSLASVPVLRLGEP